MHSLPLARGDDTVPGTRRKTFAQYTELFRSSSSLFLGEKSDPYSLHRIRIRIKVLTKNKNNFILEMISVSEYRKGLNPEPGLMMFLSIFITYYWVPVSSLEAGPEAAHLFLAVLQVCPHFPA